MDFGDDRDYKCPYCPYICYSCAAFGTHINKHKWYEVLAKRLFGYKAKKERS